jgi:hypothetical protein
MVWSGVEVFARPGRDVLLLGKQDDLPVSSDLQEKAERSGWPWSQPEISSVACGWW